MDFYKTLPKAPEHLSSAKILKRLIDGLGFRYQLATDGLTEIDFNFRPVPSSMNIAEVNTHIFHLSRWSAKSLGTKLKDKYEIANFNSTREAILELLHNTAGQLEILSDQELETKEIYLKRTDSTYPFWFLVNGFIADALTHVGQINSWRRMAGNPVARISPFTGEPY